MHNNTRKCLSRVYPAKELACDRVTHTFRGHLAKELACDRVTHTFRGHLAKELTCDRVTHIFRGHSAKELACDYEQGDPYIPRALNQGIGL